MNTYVKRALRTTLVASGLVLAGTAAAHAADTDGIANGSEVTAPVTVGVDLSGMSLGLLGDATSAVVQPAPAAPAAPVVGEGPAAELPVQAPAEAAPVTDGIANGTDVTAPVTVDLDLSGIAVGGIGDAESTVVEAPAPAAPAPAPEAPAPAPETAPVPAPVTDGIANGTDVTAPVGVDLDLSGIAVGGIGDAESTVVAPTTGTTPAAPAAPATPVTPVTEGTSGTVTDGVLNGTGALAPVVVDLDLSGLALGVIGDATSTTVVAPSPAPGTGGFTPTPPAEGTPGTPGTPGATDGIANGTDVTAPVAVNVDLSGLALGVIGDATSTTVQDGTGTAAPTTPVGVSTGGLLDGLLNDLGITAPVSLGVDLSGIAVGVIGDAESTVVVPGQPVTPVDPTDPTDPVDPTDPTDPNEPVDGTDITDPTTPTVPVDSGITGGGAGGTTTVGSDGSAVTGSAAIGSADRQASTVSGSGWTAQGWTAQSAPSSELAHTGTQAPGLLALTGLLLLAGLVLRRTALRGKA